MKTSSRTRKEPMLPVTPGVIPPRLRTKTKKETTSTKMVVVLVDEIDVLFKGQLRESKNEGEGKDGRGCKR